ncbi:3-hydroxyacyl-CoA dehydrogenase, NAD binding domain [Streptomyces noursei ATCC 11455]|nr:3-hydroxyacyl-CoA dehydrogenase, NAD binding domain [Streptomyces noursei ATCC 11455]
MATTRADRVLELRFFTPVPVMPLVEIVNALHTGSAAVTGVEGFVTSSLGKSAMHSRDRAGFVVNALLVLYLLAGIRMGESGFARGTDIDTVAAIAHSLCEKFKGPALRVDASRYCWSVSSAVRRSTQ